MSSTDGKLSDHGELVAVRHAESLANVAFRDAETSGASVELGCRDADVALSPRGSQQATALGHWLQKRPLPEVVYCSPYLRARQTWRIAAGELSDAQPAVADERLRDREMGQLELLTPAMIRHRHPEEGRRRADVGDFYYRPLGGESLADVALRLRSFLRDLDRTRRTLLIGHDAVVLLLRYLTESASEEDLLQVPPVANASVSRWTMAPGRTLRLVAYNEIGHLPAE